ncbi:ABC transporter permease [Desulfothermobacter acidiphilus]|uniref:ABC transporter permease n=1 Tax=Desulfothermobacter acidiphilus TaxID=1938353 RepID=UPI003F899EE1
MRDWFPIVWEEMLTWRHRFWFYLITYTLSPLIFLLSFGLGVGYRFRLMLPGNVSYLEFLVPGIVALAVFNNAVSSVIIRLFYSRLFFRTFEAYRLAPVSNFSLWWGFVLTGALRGLFAGLIVLLLALLLIPGVRLPWHLLYWLPLAAIVCSSFGVFLGFCLRSFDDQALINEFLLIPMSFFSGTLAALDRLPPFLQKLIWLSPLTPVTQALRHVFACKPVPFSLMVLLAAWLVLFGLLSWWRLMRQED